MDLMYVDILSAHAVMTAGLQPLGDCGLGPVPEQRAWIPFSTEVMIMNSIIR